MHLQSILYPAKESGRKSYPWQKVNRPGLFLARAGRREDYRNRDEWGDPNTPGASWLDRIGGLMPVSYSGIILLICILVFFLRRSVSPLDLWTTTWSSIPIIVVERPWTILTHMFVHSDFNHLFFNMLFLFFFGMELERRVGGSKFLQIYILSGIVAALAQMAVTSGSLVGASGAYSALWDVWP